jgi:ABC-type branched-subunit amino acid transport system permease subunit
MIDDLRTGLRTGLIFGGIVLFLALIGFLAVAAQILTELFHSGQTVSLALVVVLLGFWVGSIKQVSASKDNMTWREITVRSLAAGVLSGLIFALFVFTIASERIMKVDLRRYLYQLSPDTIELYALHQSPVIAALIMLILLVGSCLLGAALRHELGLLHAGETVRQRWNDLSSSVNRIPAISRTKNSPYTRYVLFGLLILALLLNPFYLSNYWVFILGTIGIYVLIGLGLNIVVGFAGLLDLGYVAFYAVGAYTVGLLTAPAPHHLLWNFWIALPIGIVLAATAGVLLGIPVLRLRGDYLAIVTLGFGEIIRVLSKSDALTPVTGGPQGVPTIGTPSLFGLSLGDERGFLYLIVASIMLLIFIINRLQHSQVGRAWVAIREDETVAQAMGINTLYYKLLAFGIGAACAGLGGVLFASRNGFTGPEDFTLMVSINVLAVVIVGGMGSIPGIIVGAFVLKGMPEILRDLDQFRILAFGALLVIMMILRPQGLWPSARRRLEMHIEEVPAGEPDTSHQHEVAS